MGFPGGKVVKNPTANAATQVQSLPWEDATGHVCSQLLSLCSRAPESQLLKPACIEPVLCNKRSHHDKKPMLPATREKSTQQRRPAQTKINKSLKKFF